MGRLYTLARKGWQSMSDFVEMVLEGLVCENCGELMDDMEEVGYPRSCQDCTMEIEETGKKYEY